MTSLYKFWLLAIFLILILPCCKNSDGGNTSNDKETQLQKKELELKQKEQDLKQKEEELQNTPTVSVPVPVSNELTSDLAKQLIAEKLKLPAYHYRSIVVEDEGSTASVTKSKLLKFESLGVLTVSEEPAAQYMIRKVIGNFTKEGEKYLLNDKATVLGGMTRVKVRARSVKLSEITGIIQAKENMSQVNFTLNSYDYTPFGVILYNGREEDIKGWATLMRYDGKWQIGEISFGGVPDVKDIFPISSASNH